MAHVLCGFLNSASSWRTILHPMSEEQLLVYNLIIARYPGTVIAGGFAAHNIHWKASHDDVDYFIAVYDVKKMKEVRDNVLGDLEKAYDHPPANVFRYFIEHTEADMHRSKETPLIRLTNAILKVDIVITLIPSPSPALNKHQIHLWNAFYVTVGFDFMLSKVAIIRYLTGEGLFVVFGNKQQGIQEIQIRRDVALATKAEVEDFVARKAGRLRSIDRSVYDQLIGSIDHKLRRLMKYSRNVEAVTQVDANTLAAASMYSFSYLCKANSIYSLPPCIKFFEDKALSRPEILSPLRDWVNKNVSANCRQMHRALRLPQVPITRTCVKCKFPRSFYIDY